MKTIAVVGKAKGQHGHSVNQILGQLELFCLKESIMVMKDVTKGWAQVK
jgi:hypothetical protein